MLIASILNCRSKPHTVCVCVTKMDVKALKPWGEKGVSNWIFNIDPVSHTRSPQDETDDNNYGEFYDN